MDKAKLMTESVAAKVLGISEATLYRLRRDLLISSYRIRGRVMFSDAHLSDYLERVERKANAESPASQAA